MLVTVHNAASATTLPEPVYPLKVSAHGRYLVDQQNVPFLLMGDAPQSLIVNLSEAEANQFFANRRAIGFNAVWVNLLCNTGTAGRADGSTYDGLRPFTSAGDLVTPNEAYFTRVERMLQIAAHYGITVFLDPIETIGWLRVLQDNGVPKARAYGQYLGTRYQHVDNLVWMSGNDFQTWRSSSDNELVQAVALGIRETDTRHIHTIELDYFVSSSLDNSAWEPIISLNAVYTYYPTYAEVLHAYNQATMPVFLVEAHYEFENDYPGPAMLRRQAYWTALSGATGQFYGSAYIWQFLSGWQTHLDTAGAVQMGDVQALLAPRQWYNLVPDQNHTVVTAGYGTFASTGNVNANDYATAARTADGSLVLAYMPTLRTLTVDMTQLRGAVTAQWYDPSKGTYVALPGSPFTNTGTQQFRPAGNNSAGDGDWVLVLEASSSGTGTPTPAPTPTRPIANAGSDQIVNAGSMVTLNGLGSSDPDGNSLTFRWTQTAGSTVALNTVSSATPTFTAPPVSADTALTFQLIVNDGMTDSPPAQVTIAVKALPSSSGQAPSGGQTPPGGGGGGGCALNPHAEFDPMMIAMGSLVLAYLVWQGLRRRVAVRRVGCAPIVSQRTMWRSTAGRTDQVVSQPQGYGATLEWTSNSHCHAMICLLPGIVGTMRCRSAARL